MRWVKLYVEILDDHKMALLPDNIFRTCVNLIALAGRVDDAGRLGCTEEIAYALRLSHEQARADLEELRKVRVTNEKKGVWYLKNFDKRNERPPSSQRDAVKQRVQKHREIKAVLEEVKQIGNDPVTKLHDVGNDPRIDKNRVEEIREEKPYGADAPAEIPEKKPEPLSDGQVQFLKAFGAKQFKTHVQREAVLKLETTYGAPKLAECAAWASKRGMNMGAAVISIEKAIKNWGVPKPTPGAVVIKPFEMSPEQIAMRDQMREFKAKQNANAI